MVTAETTFAAKIENTTPDFAATYETEFETATPTQLKLGRKYPWLLSSKQPLLNR